MRGLVFAAMVFSATAGMAQTPSADLTPRVSKLEGEMRAVQRKVFPGGDVKFFAPEIVPQAAPVEAVGNPATSAVADLIARVDSLERQQRALIGDVEGLQFKTRQLETQLSKFRADAEFRLNAVESAARTEVPSETALPFKPETKTATPPAKGTGKTDAGKIDAGKTSAGKPAPAKPDLAKADGAMDLVEAAWRQSYASVAAKDYDKAELAMLDFIAAYPKAPRAASAQYWLGRTYAARGSAAQAAKAFLDGYQKYPKSDRGADSLIGLGGALTVLKKPEQACRAYNEVLSVYAAKLSASQKEAVAKARIAAKCDG